MPDDLLTGVAGQRAGRGDFNRGRIEQFAAHRSAEQKQRTGGLPGNTRSNNQWDQYRADDTNRAGLRNDRGIDKKRHRNPAGNQQPAHMAQRIAKQMHQVGVAIGQLADIGKSHRRTDGDHRGRADHSTGKLCEELRERVEPCAGDIVLRRTHKEHRCRCQDQNQPNIRASE